MTDDGKRAGRSHWALIRTAFATEKPKRRDYGEVVTELNASMLVGKGSVLERVSHVPVTHMGYFKLPMDAALAELKLKDRRSAKVWEYVKSAGIWI